MVMITSTPDRDALSRLDRRALSFGDAGWDTGDASTTAVPDAATERWSGGFGDAYDGTPYGPYAGATPPAPPAPEPSRSERIADYWRLYSSSPSAIMSGMTAVGVSVAELAAATGQSQDAVGRYLQAGGASDGFGGWFDPAIAAAAAAAAAAAERRDLIATYWAANKNDPGTVLKAMGTYQVSVAELAQATGQTVDQVNACLYPALVGPLPPATDVPTQLPAVVLAAAGTTTVTADTTTTTVAIDTGSTTTTSPPTSDAPSSAPNLVTSVPTSSPSLGEVLNALITPAPLNPADAGFWTLDYADFTGQMETRLSATAAGSKPSQAWSNPNGDGGDMVRLALPNGQSFMVSGGDSYVYGFDVGHGPTPTREVKETESGNTNDYVDDLEQLAMRWGLADQYSPADTQAGRDALWDAIAKKDSAVTGMDWSQPYWEISTDLSEVLGQDTSRWHAVLRYQREGDKLVLRGDPSMYFQPSIGHENVMGVLSVVGAALSGFLAPASGGAGAATAGAGEAATGAGFNAALDSHLANVLIEAGGGNALAGYAGTVLSAAVPATTTAAATGLAGLGTQLGTALGLGQYAATGGNFLIRVGIQTLANGGDWKSAVLGAVGGGLGGEAVKLLEGANMTGPLFTVLGQATGSILVGQDPLQALLGSGLNEGLTGLTGQIPGFNNLPDVVKNTVVSTMSGLLQGQDISVSLLNTALTAGLDVAVRGVQAGNSTNANTNTGTNVTGNPGRSNYTDTYGAGPVFNVGAFDEATNTWATTMGDGNDGTQGVGNWSSRDYLNGWDVQSDLADVRQSDDGSGSGDDDATRTGMTGKTGTVTVGPLTPVSTAPLTVLTLGATTSSGGADSVYEDRFRFVPGTAGSLPAGGFEGLSLARDLPRLEDQYAPIFQDGRVGVGLPYRDLAGDVYYRTFDASGAFVRWVTVGASLAPATSLATLSQGVLATELEFGPPQLKLMAGATLFASAGVALWWASNNAGTWMPSDSLSPEEIEWLTRPITIPLPDPQPTGTPPLLVTTDQQPTTTTTPITQQPTGTGIETLPAAPPPTIDDYLVTRNADNNRDLADQRHQENPNLADPNQLIGKNGPNGIGVWVYPDQPRTSSGAEYEEQRTGKPSGIEINVGGTVVQTSSGSVTAIGGANFDGVRVDASGRTVLIDTKDWENFVLPDKDFWVDKVVGPAQSQTKAVEGAGINATIEWQVSTQEAADAIAQTLRDKDITGITVVVAPKKGP